MTYVLHRLRRDTLGPCVSFDVETYAERNVWARRDTAYVMTKHYCIQRDSSNASKSYVALRTSCFATKLRRLESVHAQAEISMRLGFKSLFSQRIETGLLPVLRSGLDVHVLLGATWDGKEGDTVWCFSCTMHLRNPISPDEQGAMLELCPTLQ
jgi:hypothetical protein